ncbi:pseudouridine synthase [Xylariaceae sp. FL0594]|nr:pseudouridine synthase [Xylariaceae sp. FL0594]
MATHTSMAQGSDATMRNLLEKRLGITHFVSTRKHGWSGQTRTRYTDFQVNEITKDGEVVHLKDFFNNSRELARAAGPKSAQPSSDSQGPPQAGTQGTPADGDQRATKTEESASTVPSTEKSDASTAEVTKADKTALADLVGQAATDELVAFYDKIRQDSAGSRKIQGDVSIPTIEDKARRSQVHREIRRIFNGKIDTVTGPDGSIKATAARGGSGQRGNRSTNNGGRNSRQNAAHGTNGTNGPYLHFSLYKENKDTMDALSHMAKVLRIHPKAFGAAGTKDRRAVTVQRVSVKGRSPASVVLVNERIPNVKIGDFSYAKDPIKLNDHDGNEFVIVLKNCVFSGTDHLSFEDKLSVAKATVESAMAQVAQHGFLNYYGTQRFGTHQIGTQDIGMKILKGDFGGAAKALLSFDPALLQDSDQDQGRAAGVHRDDINRARACSKFLENNDSKAALAVLPPRCHVEKALMQHLGRSPSDYLGALMSINRSMRTMYGHAYQSLVWNFVASRRWERFGSQVINGDLVLVKSKSAPPQNIDEADLDMVWEDEIASVKNVGLVVHAVTEDDLQDGKYSIYDIVLPTPGWDVIYPSNEIGDFYAEFMERPENGGLDPYNMQRRQRDFSLPGSYRKLMGRLKRVPTASVQAYSSDLEQLVPTDVDIIRSNKAKAAEHAARLRAAAAQEAQSRVQVEKRQPEDATPAVCSPVRISETWIQTSRDGSNKRFRIARHTDTATDKAATTPVPVSTGDAVQNGSSSTGDSTTEMDVDSVAKADVPGPEDTLGEQATSTSVASSIFAAVKKQVRAIANSILNAIHRVMAFFRISADSESTKPTSEEAQPQQVELTPQEEPAAVDDTVKVDGDSKVSESHSGSDAAAANGTISSILPASEVADILASDPAAAPAPAPVEPASTGADEIGSKASDALDTTVDAKKIAVILRFALDTSQYATMVIRELQGTPAENDPA